MLGVGEAASAVCACATSTVCQIWVKASDGSVVDAPPPQEASPIIMKTINSQVSFENRDILSSKNNSFNEVLVRAGSFFFIITESN